MNEFLLLVIGALLGAITAHFLGRDSKSRDKRAAAKVMIRDMLDAIADGNPAFYIELHEVNSITIKQLKNTLVDDLYFWRKDKFITSCLAYIRLTDADVHPVGYPASANRPATKQEKERNDEAWFKPSKVMTKHLILILSSI